MITGEGKGQEGQKLNFTCLELEVYSVKFESSPLDSQDMNLESKSPRITLTNEQENLLFDELDKVD